jgi:L-methionine (R)-S-oxide reductase
MKSSYKQDYYENAIEKLRYFLECYDKDGLLGLDAKLATIVSVLKNYLTQDLNFIGFYMIKSSKKEKLILEDGKILEIGAYMSDIVATPVIEYGKGVVGTCWKNKDVVIIENVKECKNYIACDDVTKSEICLPLIINNEIIGVLDIDSVDLNRFDETDKKYLTTLLEMISS